VHDVEFASGRSGRPARVWAVHAVALLAVAGLAVVLPRFLPRGPAELGASTGAIGFVVVAVALEASRRRRIGARFALAGGAAVVLTAWALLVPGRLATADDPVNLLMPLAPAFVLYAGYGYDRGRRRAWIAAALIAVVVVHPWSTSVATAAGGLLWVCAPLLFGFYLVARQQLVTTLTDRAESAERERDLLADRARTEERVRLAAELHDVVTHRVSLMVLHAGALRITATDDATRASAESVRATGCAALDELRDVIGVLRSGRVRRDDGPARRGVAVPGSGVRPAGKPRVDGADVRVGVAAIVWSVLLSFVVLYWRWTTGEAEGTIPWLEIGLQLPAAVALTVRRRFPDLVVAVTLVNSLLLLGLSLTGPPPWLATSDSTTLLVPAATPLVTYAAAAHYRRPGTTAALVTGLTVLAARPWAPHLPVITVAAVFVGVPALLGLYVGARRRLIAALLERADRARREQRLLADRARAEERAGLATEMHDVVASRVHEMLARATQLGVDAPSAEAEGAADELITTGRRALDELHDLVVALRAAPEQREHVDDPFVGHAVGPADLTRLVAESTAVGGPVDLVEEGDPTTLSPTVARTTYRVVREALTNVRKHAHGARAQVWVRYAGNGVRIEVRNGPPPADSAVPHPGDPQLASGGSGTGLLGVRHRVELVDGTLQAGPTAEGGFVVDAILPAYVPTSTPAAEEPSR
jgi:signal transduction histidine kinase